MNEKQFAAWRRIRDKGFLRYLLFHGLLIYGLIFTILTTGFDWLMGQTGGAPPVYAIPMRIFGFGVFMGCTMWWLQERQFRRAAAKQGAASCSELSS